MTLCMPANVGDLFFLAVELTSISGSKVMCLQSVTAAMAHRSVLPVILYLRY